MQPLTTTSAFELFAAFGDAYAEKINKAIDHFDWPQVQKLVELIALAQRRDQQVFIIGNGGSAATASHFACDLMKSALSGQRALRVSSLTDNVSAMTAIANDEGFDRIFADQLAGTFRDGDLLIAISAMGHSPNLVRAMDYARSNGGATAAIVGAGGGAIGGLADVSIVIDASEYGPIEDCHLILTHIIAGYLRQMWAETKS